MLKYMYAHLQKKIATVKFEQCPIMEDRQPLLFYPLFANHYKYSPTRYLIVFGYTQLMHVTNPIILHVTTMCSNTPFLHNSVQCTLNIHVTNRTPAVNNSQENFSATPHYQGHPDKKVYSIVHSSM